MYDANTLAIYAQMPSSHRSEYAAWKNYIERQYSAATDEEVRDIAWRRLMGERDQWRQSLLRCRGERYVDCRFSNFETGDDEKKLAAMEKVREYTRNLPATIGDGGGLILFGPKGTGKDHLAMAATQNAIMYHGIDVEWVNGMDLFGHFRDAMNSDDTTEREIVNEYARRQVLYISDPVPPAGNLTEYQSAILFRILDTRYSHKRPTWVTVNVMSAQELDARIGTQNGDRLRDGALAIFCNWASYRKVMQ